MESRVTHSLVTALRDVPGFESVDERVLLALIGESANLYWPEGSTVFRHGTPATGSTSASSARAGGSEGTAWRAGRRLRGASSGRWRPWPGRPTNPTGVSARAAS